MARRGLSLHIGVMMLLSCPSARAEDAAAERTMVSLSKVFWQGALTNILNPKIALFFLAFLPQFVAAEAPHKAFAFMLLGLIFIFNGTLWCVGLAAFASRAASRIGRSGRAVLWINRALGGMFVLLGTRIAMLQAR
jgi:threonine/homoserine/homoserine lactone efflux protein